MKVSVFFFKFYQPACLKLPSKLDFVGKTVSFLIFSIPAPLCEVLTYLPLTENQLYYYLRFYVSFHYVNYSLKHYPELPFEEFQKAFLKICYFMPSSCPRFPCLFELPFMMINNCSWFHSHLFFVHKSPEEDNQVLCPLDLLRKNTPFFFLVLYSCNNFLILSLKDLWSISNHIVVTEFKDTAILSKLCSLSREPSLCWHISCKTISLHNKLVLFGPNHFPG